jgi:subtilisin family serine protease
VNARRHINRVCRQSESKAALPDWGSESLWDSRPFVLLVSTVLCLQLQTVAGEAPPGLLVKWKDGPNSLAAAAGNGQIGSTVQRNFNALGWQLVELPPDMSVREGIKAYQALDTVAAVEPDGFTLLEPPPPPSSNSELRLFAAQGLTPNDPSYGSQWYLQTISAPAAWNITAGSTNVVVAILDSGVDYTHPDLAPNMWRNPGETGLDDGGHDKATNSIDDDNNGYVDDVHGVNVMTGSGDPMDTGYIIPPGGPLYHGTFIAGIIGAVGNNSLGIAGLNWSVQMMAIRFFGGDYSDPLVYTPTIHWSDFVAAWDYVLTMKRRGINIRVNNVSDGHYLDNAALRDALAAAGREGILSVCSAGNYRYDEDVFSRLPQGANVPSVITVAASTPSDTLADFSNFGASTVHLAAPGVSMTSTWTGSNYFGWAGTSFACPQVVGTVALLLAVNPNLTVDELKAALFGSVNQSAPLHGNVITHGRLNVARALEYLTNANPPAIVLTALPAGQRTPTNAPIQVTFNRPMDRTSVEGAFAITPPVSGSFEWTADSRSFSFHHDAPFDSTTNYTVRIAGTAQDDIGGSLDGDFDRSREGSPSDDFLWTFRFRIPNDDFANAQELAGASGSLSASNRYATFEMFEPDHLGDRTSMSSVWYRWTPPKPGGWYTFDLSSGTAFDSLLAIYGGADYDELVAVAGNDNDGTRPNSRLSFGAVAGTNYSVVVAGKSGDVTKRVVATNQAGPFTLEWYPTPPPMISSFNPTNAFPGQKVTLNGTNFTGATRMLFNGVPAVFDYATNAAFLDLTLTATVPDGAIAGPITIETPHGNFTTTGNFIVLARPLMAIHSVSGTNLIELSWPSAPGFNVQRTDVLGLSAQWTPATTFSTRLTNGIRFATVALAPTNRFFRLYRP